MRSVSSPRSSRAERDLCGFYTTLQRSRGYGNSEVGKDGKEIAEQHHCDLFYVSPSAFYLVEQ